MKRLFLFAILTLVPTAWVRADGVEIRQQYKPGLVYKQRVTIAQESSAFTGLTNSTTKTNTAFELESKVAPLENPNGKAVKVSVRYARIAMAVDKDGLKFQYDSESPAENKAAGPLQSLGGLPGRGFDAIFDEHGNVQSVQESSTLVRLLSSNVTPANVPMFQELFSPETIKNFLQQTMLRSPKSVSLKPGDTWPLSQEIQMPGFGKLLISGEYKFVGMSDFEGTRCAEIAVNASFALEPPKAVTQDLQDNDRFDSLFRQMRLKVSDSTMTGTIFFDPAISFPRALNMSQSLTIDAKVPDGTAHGIKLPMKQTLSVRLAEVGDVLPQ